MSERRGRPPVIDAWATYGRILVRASCRACVLAAGSIAKSAKELTNGRIRRWLQTADSVHLDKRTIRPERRAGLGTDAFNRDLARATPPGRASERMVTRGVEIHTDGSKVSETTKKLDLRRAGFARDFRPLSAVRFRDRPQRRFWAICRPSAPENLEWLFQWCGSLPADSDCVVDGSRARWFIPLPSA